MIIVVTVALNKTVLDSDWHVSIIISSIVQGIQNRSNQ